LLIFLSERPVVRYSNTEVGDCFGDAFPKQTAKGPFVNNF
jgi:hypothetical protein